jgi:hypothetical protein
VPAASTALIDGRELTLRGSDIPPNVASELLSALHSVSADSSRADAPLGADALCVTINPTNTSGGQELGAVSLTLGGEAGIAMHFADTSAKARATNRIDDDDGVPDSAAAVDSPEPTPDPVIAHPDEPDLHKRIKLNLKDSRVALDVIQAALAEASGFAVVSDNFDGASTIVNVPRGEIELKDCLDTITATSGQNWQKRGAIIEMRDRKWAAKRETMVSEADQKNTQSPH